MGSEVMSQFTSAVLVVYALQMIKKSAWFPWLNTETKKLNHVVAIVLAGASAMGVHVAFSAQEHSLLITGLDFWAIVHTAWHWANQYAAQRVIYDTVGKETPPK